MMSYGNVLLYGQILAPLHQSRLVPEISFIHSLQKKGPSLHYDLADIYKPVLVDRVLIRLIRRRTIRPEHFDWDEERCFMNRERTKSFSLPSRNR